MREPHARRVSVANDVADEIGMGVTKEEVPDMSVDRLKDVGMGCFAGGLNCACSQRGWQVEFFGSARCEERDNHGVNLGLDRNAARIYLMSERLFRCVG